VPEQKTVVEKAREYAKDLALKNEQPQDKPPRTAIEAARQYARERAFAGEASLEEEKV